MIQWQNNIGKIFEVLWLKCAFRKRKALYSDGQIIKRIDYCGKLDTTPINPLFCILLTKPQMEAECTQIYIFGKLSTNITRL